MDPGTNSSVGGVTAGLAFTADDRLLRSDGATRKAQASSITLTDGGALSGITTLDGTLTTAAQPNISSLGTLGSLTVDELFLNGNAITTQTSNGSVAITPNGTGRTNIVALSVTGKTDFDSIVDLNNTADSSSYNDNTSSLVCFGGASVVKTISCKALRINDETLISHFDRGTWTPSEVSSEGLTGSRVHSDNWYLRIGNLVILSGFITGWDSLSTITTSSPEWNRLNLSGLPFTIAGKATGCLSWCHPISDEVDMSGTVTDASSTTIKLVVFQHWSSTSGNVRYTCFYETT